MRELLFAEEKELFGAGFPLVWHALRQLFTSVLVKSGRYLSHFQPARQISTIIIQQIVTMPIYGKEALNICHPYMTDILRYT